jgi:exo-1,4-beta-D-glucosaminidase
MRRMLPAEHLWPIDSWWDFHSGGGVFGTIRVFSEALAARYGASTNAEEFTTKSQVMAYEGERAMFEAFGRNKYTATGVIQWMLNNAWPSTIWHLYDYYLRPGGGYFGTKKACEPLHIQYSYDDRSIAVVNSYYSAFTGLTAGVRVYNLDMREKLARDATLDIEPDGVQRVLTLPQLEGLSSTYFVRLTLKDSSGRLVSSNFYWLSTRREELDWPRSTWYHTPTKTHSDMTALSSLPKVELKVATRWDRDDAHGTAHVTVTNPSFHLAFAVRLKLMRQFERDEVISEDEVLPVIWEDNYFELLPGETREVKASCRRADCGDATPWVEIDGWNVMKASTRQP